MKELVKNIAAAVVFVCFVIVAALADEANTGNVFIIAAVLVAVAGIVTELSWRGVLDDFAEHCEKDWEKRHGV